MSEFIHIINAALDEIATTRGQQIVLRGVIDPASLPLLKVDDYQREPLPLSALAKLWQALRDGESLPDIELALRGNDYDNRDTKDEFWLPEKVFIIDGQQRRNAAVHILSIMPDLKVRLGAMIHFGTTRDWERERFKILNLDRSKVSANVLLRNMRHQSAAILTLYGLCHNQPDFALYQRVCWKQAASSEEIIAARSLVTVAATLHTHRSPAFRSALGDLIPALDRQAGFVKINQWRKNIVEFFELVDECWGLRAISIRNLNAQARVSFLAPLALVLSEHCNFWRGKFETELHVDADLRKRLASFPITDPSVAQIISAGGIGSGGGQRTRALLYSMIRDHINKGRSVNRLQNRKDMQEANAARQFSNYEAKSDEVLEYPGMAAAAPNAEGFTQDEHGNLSRVVGAK